MPLFSGRDLCIRHSVFQVGEFRVPAILREQQFTSLGFCVSLDEAFEDEKGFPAGQLAHRLWVYVKLEYCAIKACPVEFLILEA